MTYKIIQIDSQTWRIEDQGVRFFLLTGDSEALFIDSGMTVHNLKEIAKSLTSLPVRLLNTHADPDHIGGNQEFETVYMNPAELSNYHKTQHRTGSITPVWDGDIIDLGNRPLQVITLPGHTPGSIALLDVTRKVLIGGDPVQDGSIFMFGIQREIHAYRHSLEKLEKFTDKFDLIYPSHGTIPVMPSLIGELHAAVGKILAGEILPTEEKIFGTSVRKYDAGAAVFLMDEEQPTT